MKRKSQWTEKFKLFLTDFTERVRSLKTLR